MKKCIILFVLLATTYAVHSQKRLLIEDSSILLSKYEQYCTTPGKLIKTSKIVIGELRSARIEVLKSTDIRKGDTMSVVRITSLNVGREPLISIENLYITKEELAVIINALLYYSTEFRNANLSADNDYSYMSDNDVQVSCYYEEGIFNNYWIRFNKVYHVLRTPLPVWYVFSKRDVDGLLKLLVSAQRVI